MHAPDSRPRLVLVTRPTWLEELLAQHGTLGQAQFYLSSRGQSIQRLVAAHERFHHSFTAVQQALPADRRRAVVLRDQLDRFIFREDDVVLIIGQDGLVPNCAKYLRGQLACGINPDPQLYEGLLCPHRAEDTAQLLSWLEQPDGRYRIEQRTLALAQREDGQQLLALNEVYFGHHSHQTARYTLRTSTGEERQFSSGVICATGTGASGWARSIVQQRGISEQLPAPQDAALAWFVREPWASVDSATQLSFGLLAEGEELAAVSAMATGGVVFADGIEADRLEFLEGHSLRLSVAPQRLNLVLPAV